MEDPPPPEVAEGGGAPYQRHIFEFGDEILLHIVKHLLGPDFDHSELVSLATTCTKFQSLLQDRSLSDIISFSWRLKAARTVLVGYLRTRSRAELVTKLRITDLYWVPSGVLRDVIVQMPNLTEVLTAGARLSWVHLKEILTGLERISSLSWSWDCGLEETIRRKGCNSPVRFRELLDLKPKFLNLRNLLLHVPIAINCAPTDLIVCSFTSFVYLISLCQNLEQLWILSWPKTCQERKLSSTFFQETFETDDIDLPHLQVLVVNVKEPPRIHVPRLVLKLLRNLERNKIKPKVLWLDDPLIIRQRFPPGWSFFVRRGISFEDTVWPDLDLSLIERLAVPLMNQTLGMKVPKPFPSCKALHISHGMPRIVSFKRKFDEASELESLSCNAFNFKMDWRNLALHHPKLKEVNFQKIEGVYPDYCAALAEMRFLQKISIPLECLVEIKDAKILSEFHDCIPKDANSTGESSQSQTFSFKKRRVGLSTKPSATGISGLRLLTQRCSRVDEVEIGYSTKTCHPGQLLVDGLFDLKQWNLLRKISLDNVPIKHGKFLIEVAKSAPLESIRLSNLGPTGRCAYIADLAIAVRHCPNLKDLRLEQNYVGSLTQLLISLQQCRKLERLLLWSSPNDEPLDCEGVKTLFDICKDLFVFYAVVEPTLKISCKKLKKFLTDKYKDERPTLSVFIETSLEDDRVPVYPSVHFRQMVINITQVCQYNDFPTFHAM